MGGSAIGGALARAALGDHASRPILSARGYGLPPWTTPDTTVLCASYSGDTEETLACYEAAGALGARARRRDHRRRAGRAGARRRRAGHPGRRRLPAARGRRLHDWSPRSRSPRCAAPGRAWPPRSTSPPTHLEALVVEWGPDGAEDSEAKALARGLHGTRPGDRRRRARPRRSPTAGRPSSTRTPRSRPSRTSCPSSTTTRSSAGRGAADLGRFGAVFLDDCDTHPRVQRAHRADRSELDRPTARRATFRRRARAARPRSSACSRSCCSATSSRSTSRRCAASTRRRSPCSTAQGPARRA